MTFERETRYDVFKHKDLTDPQRQYIRDAIVVQGFPTRECVVVESDWPEYEHVWSMIERRCERGEESVTISKKKYEDLLDAQQRLIALESGGVDNWDWYSESLEPYYEWRDKRDAENAGS